MASARPIAGPGRSTVGWIQTMLHRRRGVRWVAAAGAAVAVFVVLGSDDPSTGGPEVLAIQPAGPVDRLPPDTRGVPVPGGNPAFNPGDMVDIHEIRTGAAVVVDATVVMAGEDDTIVAVPVDQVDAMVDALTTGGVILVLVPRSGELPANRNIG